MSPQQRAGESLRARHCDIGSRIIRAALDGNPLPLPKLRTRADRLDDLESLCARLARKVAELERRL